MANVCKTIATIKAKKETLDWLDEKLSKGAEAIIEQFGSQRAENMIDRIGCKWIDPVDLWGDESELVWNVDSAWYPPDVLLKNMFVQLRTIDPTATIEGTYEDEGFRPVGVFKIDEAGWDYLEADIDDDQWEWEEENPDGFFYDDVVQPVLEELMMDLKDEYEELEASQDEEE